MGGVARGLHDVVFEAIPSPMWIFDRETLAFLVISDAALREYGYTRDEIATLTAADLWAAEDDEAQRREVLQVPDGAPRRWVHRRKDGTPLVVDVLARDLELDGRPARLVLATDVTARVRAEAELRRMHEQLRHAQKLEAVGRLARGVAHDTNNILTVILAYASMLAEDEALSATRREDVLEIRKAAERGTGITRQLLALARTTPASVIALDLAEVVEAFSPALHHLLGEEVQLDVRRRAAPSVLADRDQLEQVLWNLALNARDAMPSGGVLTIEIGVVELEPDTAAERKLRPGRHAVLSITDTGVGMDAETQRRIFEPFFTTKPHGLGAGLGLSVVQDIVTQAGGALTAYSERGVGTTFRLLLPTTDRAPGVLAPEPAPTQLPALTVLVVDDDRDVRAAAARILRDAGCAVLEAGTAAEAHRSCVRHAGTIDVLLVDAVLPDERGDLLLRELVGVRPGARALLMSGYPTGLLEGVELLAKPFTPSELRGAIARVARDDAAARRPHADVEHPRVLLADDDERVRRVLHRVLSRAGFHVTEAATGANAIEVLASSRLDVIVADVQMPSGSGLDVLRAVRRVDLDVPVILMTGKDDLAAAAEAVEHGAFRFLPKPVESQPFVQAVQHAARAHALARLRREAFSIARGHKGGAHDRAGLEVRFESALEKLWLAYQPIVDARTGATYAVEALMRSDEPTMANPAALLEAATQLVRLQPLGRAVRRAAARGLDTRDEPIAVFVNLHPEDLLDGDLVDELAPLSRVARRVVLEITERAALSSSPVLAERIRRLRELGFRLAVDDIGAGYSGLTTFTELEPELVKIDMSLVTDIHRSALKQRTVAALCRLCHESGALVVGEGVETAAERDTLVELGCDLLQGYLIGRPQRE